MKVDYLKVSILCLTYNQKKFVKQTLDSFLMQKTNFAFEVLIHDDASTDGTVGVIEEYEKKYPNIIKPIYQKENQYSKGIKITSIYQLPRAKGNYIALCEGDDFWTDPNKLQKQVDLMDSHPDYALCFHPVKVFFENRQEKDSIYPIEKSGFTVEKLLKNNFIQTNSVMYKRQKYDKLPTDIMPGDWFLHLYHAQFGKIGFIDQVMSAYRRHPDGIWWSAYENRDEFWKKYYLQHMAFCRELIKMFSHKALYKECINYLTEDFYKNIANLDKKQKSSLGQKAIAKFPEVAQFLIANLEEKITSIETSQAEKGKENEVLKSELAIKKDELFLIKSSKFWKARNAAATIVGKKQV